MYTKTAPWVLELADGTSRTIATSWPDLTMGQYARLLAIDSEVDTYGLLAAICDCTRGDIQALAPSVGNQLLQLLAFLQQQPPGLGTWPRPSQVYIPSPPGPAGWMEAKTLPVPQDLTAATFGQATDLASALEEYSEDFGELRRQALAIYLLPAYFGCSYDTDKLPAMLLAVDKIRLGEGLPVADFFILSLGESKRNTSNSSNLYPSQLQKKRQGTESLVRYGKPTRWQMLWQEGTRSKWGKYLAGRWGKYLRP